MNNEYLATGYTEEERLSYLAEMGYESEEDYLMEMVGLTEADIEAEAREMEIKGGAYNG